MPQPRAPDPSHPAGTAVVFPTATSGSAPAGVIEPVGNVRPQGGEGAMSLRLLAPVLAALVLSIAACGKGGDSGGGGGGNTVNLGAALSLTGSLSREGILTRQGYEICKDQVNAKGGIPVGGQKKKLAITYKDDKSEPDTAAQLTDQFNDDGVKLILGPYGSSSTEAAAAVVERNGQVMVDSAGADDTIFDKGYKRIFAVLSPATEYTAAIVKAVADL